MLAAQQRGLPRPGVALSSRLQALVDLCLTMKNLSWELAGPAYAEPHELLQLQVSGVVVMVTASVLRLGSFPANVVGRDRVDRSCLARRSDHAGRGDPVAALASLVNRYGDVVRGHRRAIRSLEGGDRATGALLGSQAAELCTYQQALIAYFDCPGQPPIAAAVPSCRAANRGTAQERCCGARC